MAIQGELTQWKSYPRATSGAIQMRKRGIVSTSAGQYQWKGGGRYEEKNRDHRRKAPAHCTEAGTGANPRLVRGLWRAGSNADARSGGHDRKREFTHDLSAGGSGRDALPGNA